MKCNFKDCPGSYEEKLIARASREPGGVIVIDHVPVMVCRICGDSFFTADTAQRLDCFRDPQMKPVGSVPLYEYPLWSAKQTNARQGRTNGQSGNNEMPMIKCRFSWCPGYYEEKLRARTGRQRDGQLLVVNNVPQLSCNFCADTLLDTRTLYLLEALPDSGVAPTGNAPLYEFAQGKEMQPDKELVEAGK
jgi:YgiT-type zinc finger domain-containing protein